MCLNCFIFVTYALTVNVFLTMFTNIINNQGNKNENIDKISLRITYFN